MTSTARRHRRHTLKTVTTLAILLLALVGWLARNDKLPDLSTVTGLGAQPTGTATGNTTGSTKGPMWAGMSTTPAQARAELKDLAVEPAASMSGYNRDEQFPTWEDADEHGWKTTLPQDSCNVRAAALTRVGANVKYNGNCTVTGGTFTDPYSGQKTTDPHGLDIDHVVPVAAAYRAGAINWTREQGEAYANDPLVVVPVGSSENRSKGDKGPQDWKPARKAVWCGYATRWVAIKHKYHLHLVSADERSALTAMLDTCSTSQKDRQ